MVQSTTRAIYFPKKDTYEHGASAPRETWLWVKTNGIPFWLVGEFTTHFRAYCSGWIGMFTGGQPIFDPWPHVESCHNSPGMPRRTGPQGTRADLFLLRETNPSRAGRRKRTRSAGRLFANGAAPKTWLALLLFFLFLGVRAFCLVSGGCTAYKQCTSIHVHYHLDRVDSGPGLRAICIADPFTSMGLEPIQKKAEGTAAFWGSAADWRLSYWVFIRAMGAGHSVCSRWICTRASNIES